MRKSKENSLINEIKDLICDVFPPFSYNALNVWPNINNYDKIMRKDYPENIIDQFKVVSHETIDILTCVLSDSTFPNQSEIIEESIKTFLSDGSNVSYIINIWKALIKFGISKMQVEKIIYDEKIVNSFNFLQMMIQQQLESSFSKQFKHYLISTHFMHPISQDMFFLNIYTLSRTFQALDSEQELLRLSQNLLKQAKKQ